VLTISSMLGMSSTAGAGALAANVTDEVRLGGTFPPAGNKPVAKGARVNSLQAARRLTIEAVMQL